MHAHRVNVTIPADGVREITVRLPEDMPPGPAEVIVLAESRTRDDRAQEQMLAALTALRDLPRTADEERVLQGFEDFRREHPIRLGLLERAR